MEEKKEVKTYLTSVVNPILKPMVESIVASRPQDILTFILDYAQKEISTHIDMKIIEIWHQTCIKILRTQKGRQWLKNRKKLWWRKEMLDLSRSVVEKIVEKASVLKHMGNSTRKLNSSQKFTQNLNNLVTSSKNCFSNRSCSKTYLPKIWRLWSMQLKSESVWRRSKSLQKEKREICFTLLEMDSISAPKSSMGKRPTWKLISREIFSGNCLSCITPRELPPLSVQRKVFFSHWTGPPSTILSNNLPSWDARSGKASLIKLIFFPK